MKDALEKISWGITVFAGLLVIFLILWKLFGNSPTIEELTIGLVLLLGSWVVNHNSRLAKSEVRLVMFEKNTKDSFERVKQDLNRIETKVDKILQK